MKNTIACIIVAAGDSKRLGSSKQLLFLEDSNTLIQRQLDTVLQVNGMDVFLVLGANREEILKKIRFASVTILFNPDWQKGMSESIVVGLKAIKQIGYKGIIISVVDQPFLNKEIFYKILDIVDWSKEQIIVSKYDVGSGPPTFFHHRYYQELLELEGDIGAKPIVKKYFDKVQYIDFERGSFDIDTSEDICIYKNVVKFHNR